jgi:phosphoenolpyruvate carboxylase
MTNEVADVVNTFRIIAELPSDSMGAYVISMARSASDVLAVVLLQRECGVTVGTLTCFAATSCFVWIVRHAKVYCSTSAAHEPIHPVPQNMMRVAPLFETLDDLENSTKTMQALLGNDWYRNHIKGIQEVMIG